MKYKKSYHIQNLKCEGCAHRVVTKLYTLEGISNVVVDVEGERVEFNYLDEKNPLEVLQVLDLMGYPLENESNSLGKKAKSYVSCMIGRVTQTESS